MKRQIILGMGVGQCGTQLLAEILDQQPNANITHQQPPLLLWIVKPDADALRRRFDRFLENRKEPIVGDVATYYLPYVEEAIKLRPEIRIVFPARAPRQYTTWKSTANTSTTLPQPASWCIIVVLASISMTICIVAPFQTRSNLYFTILPSMAKAGPPNSTYVMCALPRF